jgi:hypothetical protein
MLYPRGILVHVAVWLVSCLLGPFLSSGLSRETGIALVVMPFIFGIGLPFLLLGSAIWMLPFLIRALRRFDRVAYHLWVALGSSLAVICASDLGTLGDPAPPLHQRIMPAALALVLGILFSLVSDRWLRWLHGLTKRSIARLASSVSHRPNRS